MSSQVETNVKIPHWGFGHARWIYFQPGANEELAIEYASIGPGALSRLVPPVPPSTSSPLDLEGDPGINCTVNSGAGSDIHLYYRMCTIP